MIKCSDIPKASQTFRTIEWLYLYIREERDALTKKKQSTTKC